MGGSTKDDQACLGYLSEECGDWICEDTSLEDKEGGKKCGSTGHFSSFAILIGANLSSGCGSNRVDDVVTWLSVALGILAIIIVLVSAMIKEITIRVRRARIEGQFGRSDRVWML